MNSCGLMKPFNTEDVGEVAILSLTEEDLERFASEIN